MAREVQEMAAAALTGLSGIGDHEVETRIDYAVEVEGRGFADWSGTLDRDVKVFSSASTAQECADDIVRRFQHMGCSDIAETVSIVKRKVTIIYRDWVPLTDAGS